MNKILLVATAIMLSCSSRLAQHINYEPNFEKAAATALKQQKPIAILITVQGLQPISKHPNGLQVPAVIAKFNTAFINFKTEKDDTAVTGKMVRDFNVHRFPALVFLDAQGGLLFSELALLSKPEPLLAMADKAIAASKEMSLTDYDIAYAAGDSGRIFLKNYISKRKRSGLYKNADIIEKYVNSLGIADLNSYEEVLFILQAGPIVNGRAYSLAYSNRSITDSIYKNLALAERVTINNNIIGNTIKKAIEAKDVNLAYSLSNFIRQTWRSDPATGQKNAQLKMLQFYKGIKDTTNYLQQAANYYDRYYMAISIDSMRRRDSGNYELAKKNAMKNPTIIKINDSTSKKSFSFSYAKTNVMATDLNNTAWDFYKMAGNDNYLFKALNWSKRAVEMEPLPAHYDTYAHLLYKLSMFEEAVAMQKKAIDLAPGANEKQAVYKAEYEKMKSRKL